MYDGPRSPGDRGPSASEASRGWIGRVLRKPPGPVLAGAMLLVGVALMLANSYPTTHFTIAIWALAAGLAVAACWLLRAVASVISTRRLALATAAVPVVMVIILGLLALDAPLRVRFAMARADFQRAVDAAYGGASITARRIGSYPVDDVVVHERNVYFLVHGSGFLSHDGFAFLPSGAPLTPDPIAEDVSVQPMTGPWYTFSASW